MAKHTTTYGLVGYPLGHSLSPLMHNAAFKALGVKATYELFPLKVEELADFFKDLKSKDSPIFGLNITIPYKEKVIPYLDSLNPYAKKVSAVNTIVIDDKRRLCGYNTDGPGFLAHLIELGFDPKDKRVALLGAGGAARAILSVLSMIPERPSTIKVYDVEGPKAIALVEDLKKNFDLTGVETVDSIDDLNIELADLLINATPIGMKAADLPLVSDELLHPDMFVYDLVYNPKETLLLKMAKQKGAKTANGLGMLFYQGVLAFQHWAEIELPDEVKEKMRAALNAGLK